MPGMGSSFTGVLYISQVMNKLVLSSFCQMIPLTSLSKEQEFVKIFCKIKIELFPLLSKKIYCTLHDKLKTILRLSFKN